jgi:hypothetical protein
MAAGPGEHAERLTSSWLTSGLHEGVASLGVETLVYDDQAVPERLAKEHFEHLVRKLKILRCTPDDTAARTEAVQRLCGSDATRAAAVRRLAARLQRNERPPGTFKRAAWRVEHALGSPLRRRGIWPAE